MNFAVNQTVHLANDKSLNKTRYRIIEGEKNAWKLEGNEGKEFKDSELTHVIDDYMDLDFMYLAKEIIGDALFYSIIEKFISKKPAFGTDTQTFMIADTIYNLLQPTLMKFYPEGWQNLKSSDTGYLQSVDFKDAAHAVEIVIIQQLVGKFWKRTNFTHGLLRHVATAYASVALNNIGGRMIHQKWSGTEADRKKPYRY